MDDTDLGLEGCTSQQEVMNLKLSVQQLQERLAVLQNSDAEDLLELLHERDAELLQLRKAIELKDEQVARLTRSCKELYVHRKALQKELQEVHAHLVEQKRELYTSLEQKSHLEEALAEITARHTVACEETEHVRSELCVRSNLNQELSNELRDSQTSLDTAQQQLAALRQQAMNFERSSQTYLLDLQATKASAQNEIDGLHSALEDLQEQLQASVREKHALQELFDQGAETQGELKARMCALEHSVHSHQAYAQAQKERIEWFEQERQRRNEEHEQREVALISLKEQFELCKAEQAANVTRIARLIEHTSMSLEDAAGAHRQADEARQLTAQEVTHRLRQTLQEVKIRIEQLEDRVMAERARRKQIETENTELKGKLEGRNALERQSTILQNEVEKLKLKLHNNEKYLKRKLKLKNLEIEEVAIPDDIAVKAKAETGLSAEDKPIYSHTIVPPKENDPSLARPANSVQPGRMSARARNRKAPAGNATASDSHWR